MTFLLVASACFFLATCNGDFDALVTILIKTHERPQSLKQLITSIRKFYPRTTVLVADDGETSLKQRAA